MGSADEDGYGLDVADPGPDPEAIFAGSQARAHLDEALAALPVPLRECLVLCELEQLSYKEIADVTGTPIGTVMSRLWRARQMLMNLYAPSERRHDHRHLCGNDLSSAGRS